ncbi:MAG: hypothetical protein HY023_18570 [Chloroflexi bacterium]|nr:hypothetical protein [Chloroflexota bacterium]MBI3762891.1 hypothetical protein [Chloroflexota bacterium]
MARSMTRSYVLAAVSAALLAALIGVALLLVLVAMNADQTLATLVASATRGQMRLANVADALARGGPIVHRYLSK